MSVDGSDNSIDKKRKNPWFGDGVVGDDDDDGDDDMGGEKSGAPSSLSGARPVKAARRDGTERGDKDARRLPVSAGQVCHVFWLSGRFGLAIKKTRRDRL